MESKVHPMVAVPDAIRVVIRETARCLVEHPRLGEWKHSNAPWKELLHRVLNQEVTMREPGYPPYRASIMDGYAIRTNEFDKSSSEKDGKTWTHQVLDKVFAGDDPKPKRSTDTLHDLPSAYYITTGAVVPDTFDCVVPIEQCLVSTDQSKIAIHPSATIEPNKWIRPVGCDIPAHSTVLPRGHVMDAVALGLLRQSGASTVQFKTPIKVGVLSTGNELLVDSNEDDRLPQSGKIPDVNRPILLSLLSSYGTCEPIDLGIERDDDVQAMSKTIDSALEICDVIITTGGISMGETDIVEKVLVDHCGGALHFGRMHMKPGTFRARWNHCKFSILTIPLAMKQESPLHLLQFQETARESSFLQCQGIR